MTEKHRFRKEINIICGKEKNKQTSKKREN